MEKRIYLDYAAATPLLPEAAQIMDQIAREDFGNSSSLYKEGRIAKHHLENSRTVLAGSLGVHPDEIFFTSGAAEANYLAIRGLAQALKSKGRHVITMQIEHSSVLGAFHLLGQEGFQVTTLPVSADGLVDPALFRRSIRPDTLFASIQWANNEIGTIQPVRELAAIAREFRIPLHSDAAQAFPCFPLPLGSAAVSALSLSAHKIYGPKGVGALFLRRGTPFESPLCGGDQERKVRPGTPNVAGIAGFAKAVEQLEKNREAEMSRLVVLRNSLREGLLQKIADSSLNGHPEKRLPGNLNLSFRHVDGESVLIHLDLEGIACSLGSACAAGSVEPSHVLLALGKSREEAKSSIRFSLGKFTREEDIARVIQVLPPFVEELRKVSSLGGFA